MSTPEEQGGKDILLTIRALWYWLYHEDDMIGLALLCDTHSVAMWDLNGIMCNCKFN